MLLKESFISKPKRREYRPVDEPIDTVSLYLKECRETPFLTREQEVAIGQRLDAGQIAATILRGFGDQLPPDEKLRLQEKVSDRKDAADWMARANQGLCMKVAKKFTWSGLSFLDLVSEGNDGLFIAIDRWEWQRGQPFSTYAMWWIQQKVNRAVENQMHTIRVPINLQEELIKYTRFVDTYEKTHGNLPTDAIIMEALHVPKEKLNHYYRTLQLQPISLDKETLYKKHDGSYIIGDILTVDPAPFPEQQVEHEEEQVQVLAALARFSERDRMVMDYLYGLSDGTPKTIAEITELTGLTKAKIQLIEYKTLQSLRLLTMNHTIPSKSEKLSQKKENEGKKLPYYKVYEQRQRLKQQLDHELQEACARVKE